MAALRVILLLAVFAIAAGQIAHTVALSERGISQTALENSRKPRKYAVRYPSAIDDVSEEREEDDDDESEENEYERKRRQKLEDEFDTLMESFDDVYEALNYEGHRSLYLREWYVMDRRQWERKVRSYWKGGSSTDKSDDGDDDTHTYDRSSTGIYGSIPGDDDDDDSSSAVKSGSGDDKDDDDNDNSSSTSNSGTGDDGDGDGDDDDPTAVPTVSSWPTQSPSLSAAPTAFIANCRVSLHTNIKARVDLRMAIDLGWMEATYDREGKILRCTRCYELEFEDCSGGIECIDEYSCRDSSFTREDTADPMSVHCKGTESCIRSTLSNFERIRCSGFDSCADTIIVESNELECVTEDSCRGLTFQ